MAEQKNLEVEESKRLIEEKVGQLAVSSKYKSEFIANMSHELRTPLNSLLILAQQLEDNPDRNLTDTQVEYASVIHSSGNELLELLNSILDLAKVESGTVAAENEEVSLEQLRFALLREFGPVAQKTGLDYTIDLSASSPGTMVTDHQRLRQILKNLISNAFKFTESGGVHVRIGLAEEDLMSFAVTDTGIGIDDEQQQMIFEAFAQADGTTSRMYGGTGLGLSISRELVGLLGGAIEVVSAPGQGSTFTVLLPSQPHAPAGRAPEPITLRGRMPEDPIPATTGPEHAAALGPAPAPVEQLAAAPEGARSSALDERSMDGVRFLVVDDDARNLYAITALLEKGGADVTAVNSGARGVVALEDAPDIDIVLMDIMMPVMDGYDTIRTIRANEKLKSVIVIAVTGKVMAGERKRCMDAGANDYVPKPVSQAELYAALRPWLPLTGSRFTPPAKRDMSAPGPPGKAEGLRLPGAMQAVLQGRKVLVVDDDFRNIFAMTALLERALATVTAAESGAEAIAALQRSPDMDLVLMDIMMPVMDGYETIKAIRKLGEFKALPIVAVTGKAGSGERQRCLESGADDYIPKPVNADELAAALEPWLPAREVLVTP